MIRNSALYLAIVPLLTIMLACNGPAENENTEPVEHVIETHKDGTPKLVYIYAETDSTNRVERSFHETGTLMTQGEVVNGERHGEWRAFHPDGTPWSLHYYDNGKQGGPYRVYYHTGAIRIRGQYEGGDQIGEWVFFTETGDTAKVLNFDAP